MRFGILEIGIVIVIAFIILGVVRLKRVGQNGAGDEEAPAVVSQRQTGTKPKWGRHPRLQILGLIVIIVGVVLFFVYFNLGRVIFWGNMWALLAITIGALIMVLARRI